MNQILRRCLEDLEARIDPEEEELLLKQWINFTENRFQGEIFTPRRRRCSPPAVQWPKVFVNAALADYDLMALQQYGDCSKQLAEGSGLLLNVRCNYGTSIIPSLFGVKLFVMDEESDTLPTSLPFNDVEAIRRIVEAGVPNINAGLVAKVLAMAKYYQTVRKQYPKVSRYVYIYHPDFQGPMDICEIIWGSSYFYAFYENSDLVKAFLELVTETYIRAMQTWKTVVPFHERGNTHWGVYHKGNIMLRDDSAMNLSREMFDEFVRPYDQRLLDEFGGGAIHFCGKGDHFVSSLASMKGLNAVDLAQPQYNDMETIYKYTVDRGIKLLELKCKAVEEPLARGRSLHGQVHCL